MNFKSYKLFIVFIFLLCFLVFLYLRRKKLQENFECVDVGDSNIHCIRDIDDIHTFRFNQDTKYKRTVAEMNFYNFINFEITENLKNSWKI